MKYIITFVCTLFVFGDCVKLPSNFKKCNRSDPDWKECVINAGIDGIVQLNKPIPELNIPNINPFFIPEIKIEAPPGSSTVAVTQNFKNCEIYGLTNIDPNKQKFEFDFDKKIIEMSGTFPEVRMIGQYKFEGKVLLLPIRGEGTGLTTIKNLQASAIMKFEEIKKKGKHFLRITSSDLKINPGLITFNFDNLFDGNKELSDNMNKVLNENWEAVYKDIEGAYIELVNKIFITLVNGFFSKVSIEEAFD